MGDAVAAFLTANGPAQVTSYNYVQWRGAQIETALVVRRAKEASTSSLAKHDLADIFDLTPLGQEQLAVKPGKQARTCRCTCARAMAC